MFAWDLGATNCTAGIVEYDVYSHRLVCTKKSTVKLADVDSLEKLIKQLEMNLDIAAPAVDAICIGAAGHYNGTTLVHENPYPFPMNFAKVAGQQKWPSYAIIHDYAPIVCATFTSYMHEAKNIKYLNPTPMQSFGRRVALGIGTGLGLKDGILFSNGNFWLGHNEIGHIGIPYPPQADGDAIKRHVAIMNFLQQSSQSTAQPITFEKILSGAGTVRLYQFFYPSSAEDLTPEYVGSKMQDNLVPELTDAFAWYTGLFVGMVQLIFMPEGGVWITGGVAIKNLKIFDRPDFQAGIDASPAYRLQRNTYPLGILQNHEHALIGCGFYAIKRLLVPSEIRAAFV